MQFLEKLWKIWDIKLLTTERRRNYSDDICKDIAEDVETRFDASNFETDSPLLKGKNKK